MAVHTHKGIKTSSNPSKGSMKGKKKKAMNPKAKTPPAKNQRRATSR